MSYLMSKDHASYLVALNLDLNYIEQLFYFSSVGGFGNNEDKYIKHMKSLMNEKFFDIIQEKNPELTNLIDDFWIKAKKTKYIYQLFGEIFANKIDVSNFPHLIFNCLIKPYNDDRKKFIKEIINHKPLLMNDLHLKLLSSKEEDSILLASYVDLLPKHIKEIKDDNKNILNILKKTSEYAESNSIKVLDSIIKSFEPSKDVYDFLQGHFKQNFEYFHKLRFKFKSYEIKYFSSFINEKKECVLETKEEYFYYLKIKAKNLIDDYNIDKDNVYLFTTTLQNSISNIIKKEFGNQILIELNGDLISISTTNMNDIEKIKPFMDKLKNFLPQLIEKIPNKINKNDDLSMLFESFILNNKLNNELENNNNHKPKIKI